VTWAVLRDISRGCLRLSVKRLKGTSKAYSQDFDFLLIRSTSLVLFPKGITGKIALSPILGVFQRHDIASRVLSATLGLMMLFLFR